MVAPLIFILSRPSCVEKLNHDCLLLVFQEVRPQITTTVSVPPQEVHGRNLALLRLRGVRRDWKHLIDSRPDLWNTIFVSMRHPRSIDSALTYLQRSKQAHLYIYTSGGLSDVPQNETEVATEFAKRLRAATDRAVCLNLISPDSIMMEIWSTPAPNIREVVISGVAGSSVGFRGNMPNLRLMVSPPSVLPTAPPENMLRNLRSLTIQSNGQYSAPRLTGILACTPHLRILNLKNMINQKSWSPRGPGITSLPLLEHLELSACSREIAEILKIPPRASVSVLFPDFLNDCLLPGFVERTANTFLPRSFFRYTALSLNVIRGDGQPSVEVNSHWTSGGPQCNIRIQLTRGSHLAIRYAVCLLACEVVRHLQSVVSLTIHISVPQLPVRFTQWLAGFPKLETLEIKGKHMSQVLRDLLYIDVNLLPSLQSMTLEQGISVPASRALQGWLVSRERAGVPVECVFIPIDVDAVSA